MRKFFIFLALLSLTSGIIWSWSEWKTEPGGDGLSYHRLAVSLIQNRSFADQGEITARRDPGYPLFLAGVYTLFGVNNFNAVKVIQLLFFSGICFVVFFLAQELLGDKRVAQAAALLTSVFYPLALFAGKFYTELLFTLLLLSAVFTLSKGVRKYNSWHLVLAGVLFGFAALTRSIIFYFPLLISLVLLIAKVKEFKKTFAAVFLFLAVFGSVVAPWMIRNYLLFGRPVISIQSGLVLFFAVQRLKISNADLPKVFTANILGDNVAQKIFGSYDRFSIEEGNFGEFLTELNNRHLGLLEVDAIVKQEAINAIKDHPLRYAFVVSFIHFLKLHTPIFPFNSAQGLFSDPNRYQQIPELIKLGIILAVRLVYWIFLGFVIYGIMKSRFYWRRFLVVYTVILFLVLGYSLLHGIPRYLIPLHPLYIILFIYGLTSSAVFKKIRNYETQRLY